MFKKIKLLISEKIQKSKNDTIARKREEILVLNSTSIGTTAELFASKPHMLPSESEAKRKSLLLDAED